MQKKSSDNEIVAIFDFDGTITQKNTTLPFLKFISGRLFGWKFLTKLPSAIAYQLQIIDVDRLNHTIANSFFKNLSREFLYGNGQNFSKNIIPNLIKKSASERIEWHKKQGHTCVLATSAYNIYVDYWGEQSGFDWIASTKIEFDANGQATGKLQGKSCHGKEKLRRVLELIDKPKVVYAYGDSEGDHDILKFATHSYYRKFK